MWQHNFGIEPIDSTDFSIEHFTCTGYNILLLYRQTWYMSYCALIGSSTGRQSLHILLVVKKKKKMAKCLAKVNEQEIRELLDNTTPKIPCLSIIK